MQNNVFEVVLVIKAECRTGDSVAFILELSYGGVFTLNVPQESLEAVLLVECPRLLFPFARNIVADATRDGGFPPVMIGPVDFMSMYQNRQPQEGAAGHWLNRSGAPDWRVDLVHERGVTRLFLVAWGMGTGPA